MARAFSATTAHSFTKSCRQTTKHIHRDAENIEEQPMPKGNSPDPFQHGGINWEGYSVCSRGISESNDGADPADQWGPDDACWVDHIDKKSNQRPDKESKYNSEKTVLDTPRWPSDERVARTSAQAYTSNPYRGSKKG
jgi:hypothetical protein